MMTRDEMKKIMRIRLRDILPIVCDKYGISKLSDLNVVGIADMIHEQMELDDLSFASDGNLYESISIRVDGCTQWCIYVPTEINEEGYEICSNGLKNNRIKGFAYEICREYLEEKLGREIV